MYIPDNDISHKTFILIETDIDILVVSVVCGTGAASPVPGDYNILLLKTLKLILVYLS